MVDGSVPYGCAPARLTVVRHGESTANEVFARAERTGDPGLAVAEETDRQVPLSAAGVGQAEALGRWLAGLGARERPHLVVCSPYVRAVRTWEVMASVARAAGASYGPAPFDERLRDREMGVLELMTPPAVRASAPAEADRRGRVGEWFYRPPGGESLADVTLRVRDFLAEFGPAAAGRRVLLVAHDSVVLAVGRVLAGIGGAPAAAAPSQVPNASVSRWVRDGAGLRPVEIGGTRHLGAGR
ncbi:histidine phosphatase family protein [Actinacidiphila reveromycinica]|uniref:histidine phosphatase family protein n=1 Tax=Actinacidiphila reveromycinica TaxID=659352 RepID=UPI001F3E845B|nr:histidine phosphatase family protein [Streptomyces sp. SN-593]